MCVCVCVCVRACVCVCVHARRCGQAGAGMEKRKGCFVLFFVPTYITTGEVNHKSELVREKTNVKKRGFLCSMLSSNRSSHLKASPP